MAEFPGRDGTSVDTGARNLFDVTSWHPKPVKRMRLVKSCDECRRRKLRCTSASVAETPKATATTYPGAALPAASTPPPCSQCLRFYRVCTYGSAAASNTASATGRPAEASGPDGKSNSNSSSSSNHNAERPPKRHAVTIPSSSNRRPTSFSSLGLLLNPPSPVTHVVADQADAVSGPSQNAAATSSATPVTISPVAAAAVALSHTQALSPDSPLLTLSGPDLRRFTSTLIDEFSARMERLEKIVLAKDASALSAIPPFPSSSTLSQLHVRKQANDRHPHIIDAFSSTVRSLSVNGQGGLHTRFFSQTSARVLVNLAKEFMADKERRDTAMDLLSPLEKIYTAIQHDHSQILKPITVYVDSIMPVQKRMADILPRREMCEHLLDFFVNISEGIYRVIHVPSFRRECDLFWNSREGSGGSAAAPVSETFLPRLLCILCIGSRFETESKGLAYDRVDGVHIPTARSLVRSWLDMQRGIKTVNDMATLQTEILLLHAGRIIAPHTQRVWAELGRITRLAMAMGLHRDPSEFPAQLTPFQAECRRKLWYTIVDMDLQQSLASGLPNALRANEFTCQPPRNLDDQDLAPDMVALPTAKPIEQPTDGQMQCIAASTLALRMRANDLLCGIDALTDYGDVLTVGGELEKALDDINCLFPRSGVLSAQRKYREWRMRALMDMHVRRPLLALYRPFALSASPDCPPPTAISDVYLKSSMAMLTYMNELDQTVTAFHDVNKMYYVVLRDDIMQAAFSVCYYIRHALEAEVGHAASGGGGSSTADASTPVDRLPASAPAGGQTKPSHGVIWSSAYMIHTVERCVENLARLVGDLSCDLRDVIALATVLGSVMPAASQAERNAHIRKQVGRVLDLCVETLRNWPSLMAALSGHTVDRFGQAALPAEPLLMARAASTSTVDDSSEWEDAYFWDIWGLERE